MPLPSPNTGETQDDFMARCMGTDAVTTEYPDQDQRTAICLRQFVGEATDGKADSGEMIVKAIGPIVIKDEAKGYVEAGVAGVDIVDHDGDVFLPGVVGDGARVKLSSYSHDVVLGGAAPVGKGTITEENGRLILRGNFFMSTERGREAFYTTKELAEESEWSVGFPESSVKTVKLTEDWKSKGARRLISGATLIEVSPVLRGAMPGTGTLAVKQAVKEAVKEAEVETEAEALRVKAEAEAAAKEAEEKAEAERRDAEKKAAEEMEAKRLADEAETKRLADEVEAKRLAEEATARARREVDLEEYQRVQRSLKRMGLR